MSWAEGETVVRREVLNDGNCWLEVPVVVVRDEPGLLATYLPEDAPFTFPPHPHPHPWRNRHRWTGHGTLMLHRPGDAYAIWHFWDGPERFQEPFRRTDDGYDTQDLELDVVIAPEGGWECRDGRFTAAQADGIRAGAVELVGDLDAGRRWWDPAWAEWSPRVA